MFSTINRVYFINLDRRTDRLSACINLFSKIGIEPERIVPVAHQDANKSLCLTVANILEKSLSSGYDRVLILEDDVDFINAPATINFPNFDLFYFGFAAHSVSKVTIAGSFLKLNGNCCGSHAIVYPKHVFGEIANGLKTASTIDGYLQGLQTVKTVLCTNPPFAIQRISPSDLSTEPWRSNMRFVTLDQYNAFIVPQGGKPILCV